MAKVKMKVCKHCGTEMPAVSTICPHCGGKNKNPLFKKWWFWVIAVFLIFLLIGGGNSASDEAKKVSSSIETESGNAPIPTVDNAVIYEGNNVVISTTSMEQSGSKWNVNLLIENNSNLNLGFNAHAYGINGIMSHNNIYDMDCDVAAGKKTNVALEIPGRILDEYGIQSIRCVDVLFWAYDNDAYMKEFDTGQIEIKTDQFDETHDIIEGTTIYDTNGIKIDYLGNDGDEYLYVITNYTDSYFDYSLEDVSINDYTSSDLDSDMYGVLLQGCQSVITVKVRSDFKETNSIEDVNKIEWNLAVRPYESFENEYKIGPIEVSFE